MTDGLATALIIIVAILACIAGGAAWWVNRPLHAAHEATSRVQPLFGGDGVQFADADDDELYDDDESDDADESEPDDADTGASSPEVRSQPSRPATPPAPADLPRPGTPFSARAPLSSPGFAGRTALPERAAVPYAGARTFATAQPAGSPPSASPVNAAQPGQPSQSAQVLTQHGVASGVQPGSAPLASPAAAPVAPAASSTFAPPAWNGGQSVQFSIPTDGTLQFLPGRLELIAGKDTGREIRFVRLPDAAVPEITFGRTAGTPYRHIQLLDGTVSRMHASMRLENGRWSLTNRSSTNPVVYNGDVLGADETRALDDGDRIEMGELAFRFRSR